jgi:hypothetical protein
MSLLNTKPHWCKHAVATNRGWVNPFTQEVMVAIGNLDKRLEAEKPTIVEVKEIIMEQEIKPEVKTRKPYAPRKPKVVGEAVEYDQTKRIIAEVVEYDVDTKVIGE